MTSTPPSPILQVQLPSGPSIGEPVANLTSRTGPGVTSLLGGPSKGAACYLGTCMYSWTIVCGGGPTLTMNGSDATVSAGVTGAEDLDLTELRSFDCTAEAFITDAANRVDSAEVSFDVRGEPACRCRGLACGGAEGGGQKLAGLEASVGQFGDG